MCHIINKPTKEIFEFKCLDILIDLSQDPIENKWEMFIK
jgi:hypothetical protein